MSKFLKELAKGLKWVFIFLAILAFLVSLWIGCSWSIGWTINHFFDLKNFGPQKFLAFGSCALAFTLIIQAITIIMVSWVLLAYGRSFGLIGGKK